MQLELKLAVKGSARIKYDDVAKLAVISTNDVNIDREKINNTRISIILDKKCASHGSCKNKLVQTLPQPSTNILKWSLDGEEAAKALELIRNGRKHKPGF